MARLIDADALLHALNLDAMTEADGYKMDLMRSDIKAAINDAPTVDAVEVVRCKDCKYEGTRFCEEDSDFCKDGRRARWPIKTDATAAGA